MKNYYNDDLIKSLGLKEMDDSYPTNDGNIKKSKIKLADPSDFPEVPTCYKIPAEKQLSVVPSTIPSANTKRKFKWTESDVELTKSTARFAALGILSLILVSIFDPAGLVIQNHFESANMDMNLRSVVAGMTLIPGLSDIFHTLLKTSGTTASIKQSIIDFLKK